MTIIIFVLLILLALVAIFSVQNALPVKVTFMLWNFEASLAIVIFLSLLVGMIVGGIIMLLFYRKSKKPKITV